MERRHLGEISETKDYETEFGNVLSKKDFKYR